MTWRYTAETLMVRLCYVLLLAIEAGRRASELLTKRLDDLGAQLSWVLLAHLDESACAGPTARPSTHETGPRDSDNAPGKDTGSMVITVDPLSVHDTYYEGSM